MSNQNKVMIHHHHEWQYHRLSSIVKPITLFTITLTTTIFLILHFQPTPSPESIMAGRSFILWLHGLGDSGPANEPIKGVFRSPEFRNTTWLFPSAPPIRVTCNRGAPTPAWFDLLELPITPVTPSDESGALKAVEKVHAILDKEVAAGTDPENIFICGFSQGGALTLASALLYPKTLGGGAVFSGWFPFSSSFIERITPNARKTPFLWSHGIADKMVPFEVGQAGPAILEQAGVSCEFKAYPGLGHTISTEEIRSLESWIKAHLKSSS